MRAEWYFDYVSPFSYLHLKQFDRLPADLGIAYRPVLFAGLLGAWGHKGPAEIPAKRRQTYRYCQWYAERNGIRFRMPPAHPFNSLAALRLTIALGNDPAVVATIFDFVFGQGGDLATEAGWKALTERLGVSDAEARTGDPAVKAALRSATEAAVARGIFGVPTFAIGDELFWGADVIEMMMDYLADPGMFGGDEMARISDLPAAAQRR